MTRVPLRVHGPYRHRRQWRLDIHRDGRRSKQSFVTYAEALVAARQILTGGEITGEPHADPTVLRSTK